MAGLQRHASAGRLSVAGPVSIPGARGREAMVSRVPSAGRSVASPSRATPSPSSWRRARTGPSPHGAAGLERIARAGSILEAIHLTPWVACELVAIADRSVLVARALVQELRGALQYPSDPVVSIATVHALGSIQGSDADAVLADVLRAETGALRTHAAWAATRRPLANELIEPLVAVLTAGGLAGMHAQAALARWSADRPSGIARALRARLAGELSIDGRHHVIETLGLVHGDDVLADLERVAVDRAEADLVRVAAIAALGDRVDVSLPASVVALANGSDRVSDAVRLAQADRTIHLDRGDRGAASPGQRAFASGGGLRIAQVHLGAALDPELLRAGMGDTGGIATLLVKLGAALARDINVGQVLTIGRATPRAALDATTTSGDSHRFAPVALEPEVGSSFADAWPARVAAARGLRRVFHETGRPDLVHLRMADVGTLAASEVARSLRIQTVFSLAPDPHALIAAREASGELDRRAFAAEDAHLHFWFRAHLVERLARRAGHVILFPRERLTDQLRDLVGIDVTVQPNRYTVVPEGIDVGTIRRAVAARAAAPGPDEPGTGVLPDLLARIAALPPTRHGLPIVLSVGRLNELKGMARLATAFALDARLRARATLVIVGGDLDQPSPSEAAELARIKAIWSAHPDAASAIILLGHRPNGEVAELLAAAMLGASPLIGPDGAYACASLKEEFGLAIVEALSAGLPVVAPLVGGPATYVEGGLTGVLVDTSDPAALARGAGAALDLAGRPGRAAHAVATMSRLYDISAMANSLASIYPRVAEGDLTTLAS